MVLPVELIEAIKRRASEQGQSITGYVSELVRRDLGLSQSPHPRELAQQLDQLQTRVDQLEQRDEGL